MNMEVQLTISQENVAFFREVWRKLTVPVRPGPEGLELYRSEMQRFKNKQVLVLGATPELVDMAVSLRAGRVTSIERNSEIMIAMQQLSGEDWSSVEMIVGNWLEDRPAFRSAFNCIVCDGGLLFLAYPAQWEQLFKLVSGYLIRGGVFVAKEWAEPDSSRTFEVIKDELIQSFDRGRRELDNAKTTDAFARLVSELRLAAFIGLTRADGSFDQDPLVRRLDALNEELEKSYQNPEMISMARGALKYLARSQPETTDTVAGVPYKGAEELLVKYGLSVTEHPLPDAPVPGGNYMFVARK